MATLPLVVTTEEALAAADMASKTLQVLKASAVDGSGTEVSPLLAGFDLPTTILTGIEAVVKAIGIGTVHVGGTDLATPNTLVRRDGEGDFAAREITVDKLIFGDGTSMITAGTGGGGAGDYVLKTGDIMSGALTVNATVSAQSFTVLSGGNLKFADNTKQPTAGTTVWEASCGTEVVGDFVYISAANTVAKSDVLNGATLPTVGVIIAKLGSVATVQTGGMVHLFSGLTPGAVYFLGISGSPTTSLPVGSSGQEVWRQILGVAVDADTLLLTPDLSPVSYFTP